MPATTAWSRAIDRIFCGDSKDIRSVRLGATPDLLKTMGLGPADMVMSAGKIARARKEHPGVSLETWRNLPGLLRVPRVVFPSQRDDGSIVVVIVARDADGSPIIVPIVWDADRKANIVLSIYGKDRHDGSDPDEWITREIDRAKRENKPYFEGNGFADSKPKPEPVSEDTTSWSSDPISVDRPTKPIRNVLTLRSTVKHKPSGQP